MPATVAAEGGGVWAPDYADLNESSIREAHAFDLLVLPWTVNDPADMRRLIGWGVDGLISDRPDLALKLLG
ncbi:MAG TPA: glycerophosphodiester phosphodiesterase family protein [Rhodopila sp.]|nr:glycerophosphodiester phosphodiesterase family protein [Rhodopila sp.]